MRSCVGLFLVALSAYAQHYTISAKPGIVNYIEGKAYLNGNKLSEEAVRATFLTAGDSLSTAAGKVEVLLTPGVFLRIGDNSEIRMISAALTNTQFDVVHGEAILEAAGLLKDNAVQVTERGAVITIERNGLYRFNGDAPSAAVLDGKALVYFGDKKLDLDKNHETILGPILKAEKFDPKLEDDLYAWSNVRSEYDAAASYQTARAASLNSYGMGWGDLGWGDYGYSGFYGSGWLWNSAFGSYAWLPAYGAFYSPFGWGFYGPGAVGYAPVVTTGVYRGGNWNGHHWNGTPTNATVAIRADHPPAVGVVTASPAANQSARVQAAQSFAASNAGGHGLSAASSGFSSAGHASGSFSSGGHASGGGGGHR